MYSARARESVADTTIIVLYFTVSYRATSRGKLTSRWNSFSDGHDYPLTDDRTRLNGRMQS